MKTKDEEQPTMNDITLEARAEEQDLDRNFHARRIREPQHIEPPLVNKPGKLAWIPINDLHVDRKYQRMIRQKRVNRIANSWNWVACGCLSVSLRKDGSGYYVFDG